MNEHINRLPSKITLWGGTGQAKFIRPIIEHYGSKVVAVFDDTPNLPPPFPDVPLYVGWAGFQEWLRSNPSRAEIGFCITIGNPHGRVRVRFHERLIAEGLQAVTLAHPSAQIAPNASIGEGCQLLPPSLLFGM